MDLPLKIFGCTLFVTKIDLHKSKLDPRAQKCVFLEYSLNQKGYKCSDLVTKKNTLLQWMCSFFFKLIIF